MTAPKREIRRINAGSTYWVRRCGSAWKVTGDGEWLWGPGPYEEALRQLNAVAPTDEEEE